MAARPLHLIQISGNQKPEDSEKSAQIKLRTNSVFRDQHNRQILTANASVSRSLTRRIPGLIMGPAPTAGFSTAKNTRQNVRRKDFCKFLMGWTRGVRGLAKITTDPETRSATPRSSLIRQANPGRQPGTSESCSHVCRKPLRNYQGDNHAVSYTHLTLPTKA